jgi:outer membrane protein
MKTLPMTLLAGALLATAGAVQAQNASGPGFYRAIGYYSVNPKSDNGTLAGVFRSDINNDSEPTLTLGYHLDRNWGAEAWLPLTKFKHDVSLDGARSASIKHMPYLFTAQYYFLPDSSVRPFVGTSFDVKGGDGFVGQFGVDFYATDSVFVRADGRYFD